MTDSPALLFKVCSDCEVLFGYDQSDYPYEVVPQDECVDGGCSDVKHDLDLLGWMVDDYETVLERAKERENAEG